MLRYELSSTLKTSRYTGVSTVFVNPTSSPSTIPFSMFISAFKTKQIHAPLHTFEIGNSSCPCNLSPQPPNFEIPTLIL